MTTLESHPPPVTGRHRNRAVAAARRVQAVQLITAGLTYQQVADRMGYANRGTVHRIVSRSLAEQEVASVRTLRELENERLDALQVRVWAQAMAGDVQAVLAALRISTTRLRLNGMWEYVTAQPDEPMTVIMRTQTIE